MSGDTEPAAWSIHLHNVDWNAHAHTHAHTHTCSHTHIHSHTHSHTPGPWVSAALPVHAQAHLQFSCKVVSLAVEHRSNINYTFNLWSGQLYVWFVIKQGHRHVSICTQTSVRTRVWHKPIIPAPCEELLTFFLLERGACRRMITMQTMQTLEHMQTCERNAGAHADMWSQCRHLRAHADMWAECKRLSTHADTWEHMQTLEHTCRHLRAHADMWTECRRLSTHADIWEHMQTCERNADAWAHADMWTECRSICRHVNGMQTLESTCRHVSGMQTFEHTCRHVNWMQTCERNADTWEHMQKRNHSTYMHLYS